MAPFFSRLKDSHLFPRPGSGTLGNKCGTSATPGPTEQHLPLQVTQSATCRLHIKPGLCSGGGNVRRTSRTTDRTRSHNERLTLNIPLPLPLLPPTRLTSRPTSAPRTRSCTGSGVNIRTTYLSPRNARTATRAQFLLDTIPSQMYTCCCARPATTTSTMSGPCPQAVLLVVASPELLT